MAADSTQPRVLLVDDEALVLSSYARALRGLPITVLTAATPALALAVLDRHVIDVVIADYRMPEMNGDAFLEQVRERWPDTVRLLNTGHADLHAVEEVVRRGAIFRMLTKPCEPEKLLTAVRDAIGERSRIVASKLKAEKLALDLHSFREIFQGALDPMMVADLSGRIVEVNRAFIEANGANRVEALRVRPSLTATVVEAFLASEREFLRIRNAHNEGTETREHTSLPAEDRQTAMFRRIEQLIESSAIGRSK